MSDKNVSDEDLFDEWKALFTKYRSFGSLPDPERERFKKLSIEANKRGWLTHFSPSVKKELGLEKK